MDFYKFCQSKMPNIFIESDVLLKNICEKMESKINNTNKMLFINSKYCKFSTELSVLWIAWLNLNGNIWTAIISHNGLARKQAKSLYKEISYGKLDQFVICGGTMLGFEGVIINKALRTSNDWTTIYNIAYWFKNFFVSRITGKFPLICFYDWIDNQVIEIIKKDFLNETEFYL